MKLLTHAEQIKQNGSIKKRNQTKLIY